jgi:hypothetical protein
MVAPPTSSVAPRARPPLVRHPGRVATVVITLAVVVTLGIWALSSAETDTGPQRNVGLLPAAVEQVSPGPGELSRLQDTITVDLADDLTGVMLVDGIEIPEDQLERVEPLGQFRFRTGPDRDITKFEPGLHRVTILYWPQDKERPAQPTSYTWEFRAGA